jgi:hypothetical protein
MHHKDFDNWNEQKKKIDAQPDARVFVRGRQLNRRPTPPMQPH